jgi:hypothetical protein
MACRAVAVAATCGTLAGVPARAFAQAPAPTDAPIAFDRPEAWAMKYFTSATALSGLSTPDQRGPGSVAVQFEGGWLPSLSAAQQRVGFNGTSPEDLNQTPVVMRPRVTVGLPHHLSITAAFDPPVRAFGVTPRLIALGLDGVMHDSGTWRFGWRAHGQVGTVTAAITCPPGIASFAPGSANNPAGCSAESSDVTTLRYAGLEWQVARRISRRFVPHAAVSANIVDTVFQTGAIVYGQPDRTRLQTRGVTVGASAGAGYQMSERFSLALDLFYSPLTVRRSASSPSTMDSLLNARGLVSYRVIR